MASGTRAAGGIQLASEPSSETFGAEVLAALDERGYLASAGRWSGRRCITFAHCPYLAAARLSPAVCAFDQALMEVLLREPVVLFHRIADHDDHCMFLLGA
jgi:predicted ArsR family transcriptional regulator